MPRQMMLYEREVLKWFTSLNLEEIKRITAKHCGEDFKIEWHNGHTVIELYQLENEKQKIFLG